MKKKFEVRYFCWEKKSGDEYFRGPDVVWAYGIDTFEKAVYIAKELCQFYANNDEGYKEIRSFGNNEFETYKIDRTLDMDGIQVWVC